MKEECNKEKTSVHEKKGAKKTKASRAFTFALVERIVYYLLTGNEVVKLKLKWRSWRSSWSIHNQIRHFPSLLHRHSAVERPDNHCEDHNSDLKERPLQVETLIPRYIAYTHGKKSEAYIHEKILNVNRSQPFGGTGQRSDIKGELWVGEIDW